MAGKNTAVFGIYPGHTSLERGISTLRGAGFRNTDISVLYSQNLGNKDLAHDKESKAPEGAATGATMGAASGGVLGWLAGIGSLAIPGVGPFIAAGPIMTALAGAVGGVEGGLVRLGMPEYEAKRYQVRIRGGGILLSAHSDSSEWTKRAKEILERTGAEDVSSTGEAKDDSNQTDRATGHTA